MNRILELNGISKQFTTGNLPITVLNNISFAVEEGEFLGIMGASGSGKTTLLNILSTIDLPTSGTIKINQVELSNISSRDIAKFRRQNLGFIFQDFNLLDTLTLEENIALALTIQNQPAASISSLVLEIAQKLGIESILKKYPYAVSGGQKQRCACARAMVTKPKLILADEPTGALDSKAAQMLMGTLVTMNAELAATILMVTHDAFSASYCKRVLFLKDGIIFQELQRGMDSRKAFFGKILDVMSALGGDFADVL